MSGRLASRAMHRRQPATPYHTLVARIRCCTIRSFVVVRRHGTLCAILPRRFGMKSSTVVAAATFDARLTSSSTYQLLPVAGEGIRCGKRALSAAISLF